MVETIKFSQFASGGDLANSDLTAGLNSGTNVLFNNPWTFLPPGSTADRPSPSPSINGRLRFNTDSFAYEFFDSLSSTWVQLSAGGSGTVNAGFTNDLAFYPSNGTAVSPISTVASSILVTDAGGVPGYSTTLPAFTTSSITFSPTTGGINGTTTNDNASAGKVGEFISSQVAIGSSVSLSSATPTNLTSISLTAGDWDVWGNGVFSNTGTASLFQIALNNASATFPDGSLISGVSSGTFSFTGAFSTDAPYRRFSLSVTTTIYIVAQANFNTGGVSVCGGINARRAR